MDEIYWIDRLQYKSHVYETLKEIKKFCDSCFVSSSGVFGVIETFLFDNENVCLKMSLIFSIIIGKTTLWTLIYKFII